MPEVDEVAGFCLVVGVDPFGLVELDARTDLLGGRSGLEEGDAAKLFVDAVGTVFLVLSRPLDDLLVGDVVPVTVDRDFLIGFRECGLEVVFPVGFGVSLEVLDLRDVVVVGDPGLDLGIARGAEFEPLDLEIRLGDRPLADLARFHSEQRPANVHSTVVLGDRLVRDELVDPLRAAVGGEIDGPLVGQNLGHSQAARPKTWCLTGVGSSAVGSAISTILP